MRVCAHAKSLHLSPTLWDPMDCSLPGSSVRGTLQARILEWTAMPSPPGDLVDPGIEPWSLLSPALSGGFFTTSTIWKALMTHVLNTKSEFLREYSHVLLKDNTSKAGPTVIHCWKDQSLHIFHLSIGFWNTALITKDLILFASSS